MDFPIPPEFWWSTDILHIINSSTGMDQEIHPCGKGRIDSVKIIPSLLKMREWPVQKSQTTEGNIADLYILIYIEILLSGLLMNYDETLYHQHLRSTNQNIHPRS